MLGKPSSSSNIPATAAVHSIKLISYSQNNVSEWDHPTQGSSVATSLNRGGKRGFKSDFGILEDDQRNRKGFTSLAHNILSSERTSAMPTGNFANDYLER